MPEQLSTFHIMAALQYARALKFGFSEPDARSWASARALLFALFKNGQIVENSPIWKNLESAVPGRLKPAETGKLLQEGVGDDKMPFETRDGVRWFVFGGKQIPPDFFDREVKTAFGPNWDKALAAARERCDQFPKALASKLDFLLQVFKPVSNDWLRKFRDIGPPSRSP